jgi:hypothetical protein
MRTPAMHVLVVLGTASEAIAQSLSVLERGRVNLDKSVHVVTGQAATISGRMRSSLRSESFICDTLSTCSSTLGQSGAAPLHRRTCRSPPTNPALDAALERTPILHCMARAHRSFMGMTPEAACHVALFATPVNRTR